MLWGYVIPHFIEQIKKNIPITVTEPKMTRFLMSLEDSVDLVLHAFKNARHGDIFVQKSPSSTIANLACVLKKIFNSNVPVRYIGTRHGEKQYETLISKEEMHIAIEKGKHYRIPMDNRDLNYDNYFIKGEKKIKNFEEYSSSNAKNLSKKELEKLLLSLSYVKKKLNA